MAMEQNDIEIITEYLSGNDESLRFLISKYTKPVYNFVRHLVHSDNEAEDITQEVFIKIWKNLKKFSVSKSSFKTWLFTVARNTTIDFLRKRKNILFSDLENEENEYSFAETIADENLLPDEALQKIQNSEFLNKLLSRLNEQHRTILLLHYQEEMTFAEIGEILKKPLSTVKSYHRRAILELRKML